MGSLPPSIPLDAVGVGGAFVIFQVLQQRRFHGNMEIVGLVRAYGDERSCHGKTMQVARDAAVHIGYLLQVEIVGSRETEVPVLGRTYVT